LFGGGAYALVLDQRPGALGGLGLDHGDRHVLGAVGTGDHTAGHDHREDGPFQLAVPREGDPLTIDQRDAGGSDRAGGREAGQGGGHRGAGGGQHVVGVVGVDRQDGLHHLDLVAQPLDEQGAQRAVDQSAGQDSFAGGAALPAEERTGDLPGGVLTLFDVHRQREEVEVLLGVLSGGGGGQDHGVLVQVGDGGAGGLLGQTSGLETYGAGAER